MGLFSHKKHETPATGTTGTHHDSSLTGNHSGTHTGTGVSHPMDRDYAHEGTRTGLTGTHDNTGTHHGTGALNRRDDDYTSGGVHETSGMGHHGTSAVPTSGHHNTTGQHNLTGDHHTSTGAGSHTGAAARGTATSAGGSGKSLEGKIEKGLGTMIGSTSLKAKGMEKEREAELIKMQAAELENAEHLEAQAMKARERAAALEGSGAGHHIGGANPGAGHSTGYGDQMGTQPGFGPGAGGNSMLGGAGQARGSAF